MNTLTFRYLYRLFKINYNFFLQNTWPVFFKEMSKHDRLYYICSKIVNIIK